MQSKHKPPKLTFNGRNPLVYVLLLGDSICSIPIGKGNCESALTVVNPAANEENNDKIKIEVKTCRTFIPLKLQY
jgi:hypothetical protein